nr:uncharacterized protein LOC112276577 isoform X1 [Physcomitrium patens]|eukprot:XP_024363759.1 uncharacterized protein LOC112276577 isoform X1 [Physcomitrella patens]
MFTCAGEGMARDWNLQETKGLVKEFISLKAEKPEMLTASERWNRVAETLREKGFNRSHRSCKKRWYRLEQFEVQIFSFNMEDGKNKNYWDLTRAERLKFCDKWPQLPSGDAIDMELFDCLKRFSHVYEKDASKTASNASTTVANVEDKEVIHSEPKLETRRKSASPQPLISTPLPTPAPLSHLMFATVERNRQEEPTDSEKQSTTTWPGQSVSQALSSPEVLDGLKLQDLELRGRRAVEVWKNKTILPCTNKASTFVEINQPSQQKAQTPKRPLIPERPLFGSIKISPPLDVTNTTVLGDNSTRFVRKKRDLH